MSENLQSILLASLLFAVVFLLYFCDREIQKSNKVLVLSGQPKGSSKILRIYHKRDIDEWIFVWENPCNTEFDGVTGNNVCYMTPQPKATPEEVTQAYKLLYGGNK